MVIMRLSLPSAFVANPSLDRDAPYGPEERDILSVEKGRAAWDAIRAWPGYAPTPLRRTRARLAGEAGVAELLYKDEGHRFGLKSFKALGGAYAVERLARERDRRRADRCLRDRRQPRPRGRLGRAKASAPRR